VEETACGVIVPGLTNCLDCNGVSFCYAGEPGDLSCTAVNIGALMGSMAPGLSSQVPAMLAALSLTAMIVGFL